MATSTQYLTKCGLFLKKNNFRPGIGSVATRFRVFRLHMARPQSHRPVRQSAIEPHLLEARQELHVGLPAPGFHGSGLRRLGPLFQLFARTGRQKADRLNDDGPRMGGAEEMETIVSEREGIVGWFASCV